MSCDYGAPRRTRRWAGRIVHDLVSYGQDWPVDVEADAVQCASEFVAAALIGGTTAMTLALLSGDGFFQISLVDDSSTVTDVLDPSLLTQMAPLRLVDLLADHWGIAAAAGGRELWAVFLSRPN